ncbi:uncharacterized protein LOC100829764 [Brachypodium distachyon]|uniref:DUF3148 domain-containing protein n=1 Tax=Brachypodium distachyon TaxID=15368 RepID=I1H3H5_BRADI|nr:uncharacterized protein LOC100829764 [Brachypodium distachyon]KQK20777.1 hypothetical protein BRADI_1g56730v3 [Brachypodium distachyon]|eukprot:XP_003561396.1 uncharacterized protein LOC100829764 [Brachypodium distachyon]
MLLRPVPAAGAAAVSSPSSRVSPPGTPASQLRRRRPFTVQCAPGGANSGAPDAAAAAAKAKLKIGSPIVIVEEPPMLKTAASVPSLRQNDGRVKPGDVGRIMARRPKDVWAVRLAVGTYLLDGKHFKPLDVVQDQGVSDDQTQDQ